MIDTILAEVASRGYFIDNLFQRHDGSWQCNLRRNSYRTGYGWGDTASAAIILSLASIEEMYDPPEIEPPSLASLLSLAQPKTYRR